MAVSGLQGFWRFFGKLFKILKKLDFSIFAGFVICWAFLVLILPFLDKICQIVKLCNFQFYRFSDVFFRFLHNFDDFY